MRATSLVRILLFLLVAAFALRSWRAHATRTLTDDRGVVTRDSTTAPAAGPVRSLIEGFRQIVATRQTDLDRAVRDADADVPMRAGDASRAKPAADPAAANARAEDVAPRPEGPILHSAAAHALPIVRLWRETNTPHGLIVHVVVTPGPGSDRDLRETAAALWERAYAGEPHVRIILEQARSAKEQPRARAIYDLTPAGIVGMARVIR